MFRGQLLHVWKARLGDAAASGAPGTVTTVKRRLFVGCGKGSSLELLEVQLEGRKRVSSEAFLNGQRLERDEMLGDLNQ